jgi:hypothetical protein
MVEYLNLPRGGGGGSAGASVRDALDRSWSGALQWIETNQTTAFLIVVGVIVGLTFLQYVRGRRGRS